MTTEAYAAFQERFQSGFESQLREREADQKIRAAQIAKAERGRANLLKAIELGNLHASIFEQLTQVERELEHLRAELEAGRPRPVPLPDDLPALYRARIADLASLMNAEEISGRWADELRLLIDRIVVRHDTRQGHTIEIEGNLAEMLAAAYPALGERYRAEARSLKLVAGAGFEPAAFRL